MAEHRPATITIDWNRVEQQLDERGYARIPRLLKASDCRNLAALYDVDPRFRSTVDMERHGYGQGQYRYFANPLPRLVSNLRRSLYKPLSRIANHWNERLGQRKRFPSSLSQFQKLCDKAGQTRPTPLLLHYEAGGYNRLHQDNYGQIAFPLQVTCLLSRPELDFTGGEFLLLEQQPRMQSRGEVIHLQRGEAIVFPNQNRPVHGRKRETRCTVKHGVSPVRSGSRKALGLIFHDAR